MKKSFGCLNSKGFTSQLSQGLLPNADHITYTGLFNEIQFDVGPRTQKQLDLHLGFCRSSNPSSVSNKGINQFLAIFMKGSSDGEPRDQRILNSVIVLDVSGSMGLRLENKPDSVKTRLELAKEAIKMFVSKLRPSDSFGLVTFDDEGYTLIKGVKKSEMDLQVIFELINSIQTKGGTTLLSGFNEGTKVLKEITQQLAKEQAHYENRIIMLTDVADNSFQNSNQFISQLSTEGIHTTLIGISSSFQSDVCQKLNNVKGFNYFCAVESADLQKYLFDHFDWTFFPSAYDIQISLHSQNVKFFEVYGSPDSAKVNSYNDFGKKGQEEFTITKIKSSFPSQLKIEKQNIKTIGGLILVKLAPQPQLQSFQGKVVVNYKTGTGKPRKQEYDLDYNFPKNQQFFSDVSLEQAISAFYFVYEMKYLIQNLKGKEKNAVEIDKCIKGLEDLRETAPKSKVEEVDKMINVLKRFNEKNDKEIEK